MKLTPEFLYEISSQLLNYSQICDEIGLTEEQRKHPNAGQWLIEEWRNMVQKSNLYYTRSVMKARGKEVPPPNPLSMRVSSGAGLSVPPSTTNAATSESNIDSEQDAA
jgi:hypothetical protein